MNVFGEPELVPPFNGPMDPVFPCRRMVTRSCPAFYADVCGDRPCARYESEDVEPWLHEIRRPDRINWTVVQ